MTRYAFKKHAEWFITYVCDFNLNSIVALSLYINLRVSAQHKHYVALLAKGQ